MTLSQLLQWLHDNLPNAVPKSVQIDRGCAFVVGGDLMDDDVEESLGCWPGLDTPKNLRFLATLSGQAADIEHN